MTNKLFVSVDMDEIYSARWATGSKYSRWNDEQSYFKEIYKSDKPIGEIVEPTNRILNLFEEISFKSTFFFTAKTALYYPEMVKKISNLGHEIACHNYEHLDYEYESKEKMRNDLKRSKNLLEDLTGKKIIGYRSPNSSINKYTIELLEELEFKYDSSITPTRRFMGKFGKFTKAPLRPYFPSYDDISKVGNSKILELPWAIFPFFKFPAGSGIMHRIGGDLYNRIATKYSLNKGSVGYYFHPYELINYNYNFKLDFKTKMFFRGMGDNYFQNLKKFIFTNKERLINGKSLYHSINNNDIN